MTLDGRQINLGADKEAAFERYHQLMGTPPEQRLVGTSLVEILDAYLEWCPSNRAPRTYEWYRDRCQAFLDFKTWSSGNKRNSCRCIQRALNWAIQQGAKTPDAVVDRNGLVTEIEMS